MVGKSSGANFTTEYSYAQIKAYAESSAELPDISNIEIGDCTTGCAVDTTGEEVDDGALAWLLAQLVKEHQMPLPKIALAPSVGDLFAGAAA